jgi:hypothetical protein
MAFLSIGTVALFWVGYIIHANAMVARDTGRDDSAGAYLKTAYTFYIVGGLITIVCLIAICLMLAGI